MSGLVKAKKYNWKDSNLALFGSETDREVKKAAAEQEPAWRSAGKKPGLQVWRINKFKVEALPTTDYGQFYTGDSYIILNTYKEAQSDKLLYDVHFWIGKYSTQDEYGTAAYKTVELDTLLDDVPVQHREVQNYESAMFKKYFKTIVYKEGGYQSGFKHVLPKEYKPRLFRVCGQSASTVEAKQVKISRSKVKADDCFLLDDGKVFYHFKGSSSNFMERFRSTQVLQKLKEDRPGCETVDVEEQDGGEALDNFYEALERADAAIDDDDDDLQQQMDSEQEQKDRRRPSKLLRLSDQGGELVFQEVKEGAITKKDFNSADVFILDAPNHGLFVWKGRRASPKEKHNGMSYAQDYLRRTGHFCMPITVLSEQQENSDFRAALAA